MPDKRPIGDFRFGLEWEPKLAEIMLRFPWQDSEFSMADPAQVCKTCGRAPGSVNHVIEISVSLIRKSEMVSGAHDFEPRGPFSEAEIAAALDQWRERMKSLPTKEALDVWHAAHYLALSKLMQLLMTCKVKTRDDVETLGCTGCAAMGLTIEDTQFVRMGLAGSGVGLPCFVPPDRFCYAHGVSGGLQDGQEQRHAERVESISRPLNAAETGHSKLVTAARRARTEHDTHSLLHGHELPKGWQEEETFEEAVDGLRKEGGIDDIVAAGKMSSVNFEGVAEALDADDGQHPVIVKPWDELAATMSPERRASVQARVDAEVKKIQDRLWKCTEHEETVWTCRHCLAQAVVEGELAPACAVSNGEKGVPFRTRDVGGEILSLDSGGAVKIEIYVRAASFTRKLARD